MKKAVAQGVEVVEVVHLGCRVTLELTRWQVGAQEGFLLSELEACLAQPHRGEERLVRRRGVERVLRYAVERRAWKGLKVELLS